MRGKLRDRSRGEIALADLALELREEKAGDREDVARALAQRRHVDHEHLEAVEEIAPERPARDVLLEGHVGRHHHARGRFPTRARRADPADLVAVERAQQLRLGIDGQLADLVEEERPALRFGERADPSRDRSGERAALVSEQLALDELARQRATFIATNASGDRGPSVCSARATSSLPTPVSPATSTGALSCESRRTCAEIRRIAFELPAMPGSGSASSSSSSSSSATHTSVV